MLKIQEGQLKYAGLLFNRYKKILNGYFYNQTRNRTFSEDLVQATFYRLIKYKHNFQPRHSFKSWIFTIAKNAMIDELRKNKRNEHQELETHMDPIDQSKHADVLLLKEDRMKLLNKALESLDPQKREILYLVKIHEKKYKEVAEILSIKESAVKSKVFRAIKELQKNFSHLNYSV